MQISADLIARQLVCLMDELTCLDEIQLIIYIEFLNLGDSLPQIMYLFVPITYENQKNKKRDRY